MRNAKFTSQDAGRSCHCNSFPGIRLGTGAAVYAFLLVLLLAQPLIAQTKAGAQLSARIEPRTTTLRSNTPATLVWYLRWSGIELLEGYLNISVYDGRQKIGQIRTDEVVLSTGERRFEMRLPVLDTDEVSNQAELHAEFVTAKKRYDLREFPLRLQEYGTRTMTVGVCNPWEQRISPRQSQLIHSLRLERFKRKTNDRSLTTSFGHIRPTEMPANSLGYCGYNLVVLMDEGFGELRPDQLDALYRWASAGGSLCVLPGNGLSAAHVEFLNRLATRDQQADLFLADDRGRLISDGERDQPVIRLLHPGVGRAAVVMTADDTERDPEADEWKQMVAHLWFVQSQHVPTLVRDGDWEQIEFRRPVEEMEGIKRVESMKFEYKPISQGNWLLDRLKPKNVQVVPLSLIGLILAVYVLLIGPVDYILLGAIKQRKLTWLLFPLVTVGVTSFTVWLSKWYMEPTGDRRSVEFLDVADDNGIARRSRFELLYIGKQKKVEVSLSGEYFAPFDQQRFRAAAQHTYGRYGYQHNELVGIADYVGRIPADYTASQLIPQWTPQINRFFSIRKPTSAKDTAEPEFDWQSLQPPAVLVAVADEDRAWRNRVRERVRQHFGNRTAIWVMSQTTTEQLAGTHGLFVRKYYPQGYSDRFAYDVAEAVVDPAENAATFLTQTCRRPHVGLYSFLSRIAPTGGNTFEDLAILDRTDPQQVLLVVAVEEEGDLRIFRKLYVVD